LIIDPDFAEEFIVFRLVLEKIATLKELETYYSLDDALRMIASLDIKNHLEKKALDKIKDKQDASN
jgi:hypothetical protein